MSWLRLSCSCCRRVARCTLLRVGKRGFTHPCAVFPRFRACAQSIAVARTVALDDVVELGPVDRTEIVVRRFGVPLELRVGNGEAEEFCLRYGLIDEALPQFIVRQEL